ncbi:Zinc finger, C3HC4 type (RING finger) family protein [Leishmania donovani]|uniref:Zinc finger, C3HC4 type (RING finger) family protein n=1 Tax=Leishmania donovani TaxID=5661 RepID=A0A504XV17_LEIDO|nr:Zinc finger, C3HC4 type (RING finger) family protein [Leishmania donovani]
MDVPLPLRQFTMVPGQNIDPLFLCPLCHDSWADPVELVPCGDIFCKRCIGAARAQHAAQPMIMQNFQCPLCQTVLQSEKKPNRMLLNSVLMIEVECRYCHWRGTRESSEQQHTCTGVDGAVKSNHHSTGLSDVAFSTASTPAEGMPTREGGAQASPSPPASSPAVRNGPRRAQREIEDGYIPIGDDPSSATLRASGMSPLRDSVDPSHNCVPAEAVSVNSSCMATSPLQTPHTGPTNDSASHTCMSTSASPSHAQELWRRYGLSQIEYDQLVGVFMMFDGGAGRLSAGQLRDLCFCMNFVQREDDVGVIFASMDHACKGYVSQDDFLRWLSTHPPDPSALFGLSRYEYTDALLQFRTADPEYNGVIDASGFRYLCLRHGYAQTPEQAMRHLRLCDEQHTGYVSLRQFLQTLKSIKTGHEGDLSTPPPAISITVSSSSHSGSGRPQPVAAPGSSSPVHLSRRACASIGGGGASSFSGSSESASLQVSECFFSDTAQASLHPYTQLHAQHYGASSYTSLAQPPIRGRQADAKRAETLDSRQAVSLRLTADQTSANAAAQPSQATRVARQPVSPVEECACWEIVLLSVTFLLRYVFLLPGALFQPQPLPASSAAAVQRIESRTMLE